MASIRPDGVTANGPYCLASREALSNASTPVAGFSRIKPRAPRIRICRPSLAAATRSPAASSRAGSRFRVSVSDRGIGIAPEHQSRIFTKFFRGEARERGITGVGLGLAIARDVARSHGGDIVLADSPMGGLRAIIRVPA